MLTSSTKMTAFLPAWGPNVPWPRLKRRDMTKVWVCSAVVWAEKLCVRQKLNACVRSCECVSEIDTRITAYERISANGIICQGRDKAELYDFLIVYVTAQVISFLHAQRVSAQGSVKTRPDTRQSSRGRLGRSSNAKTARNSKTWQTDGRTDLPTDQPTRQGEESRVRD